MKGILTRGAFVIGIGNAYTDEIFWAAGISPFRKGRELSAREMACLDEAVYQVPKQAMAVLRDRMGEATHVKARGFLQVHGKGSQPCPHCGNPINTITANQRMTNYWGHWQPNILFRNQP